MNSPAADIAELLNSVGIGHIALGSMLPSAGVGVFVGDEPPEPSECITVFGYGGTADEGLTCEEIDNFRIQVRTRARNYADSHKLIKAVEGQLNRLKTYEVPDGSETVSYVVIYRLNIPTELGTDEKKRFIFTQNYAGIRQKL